MSEKKRKEDQLPAGTNAVVPAGAGPKEDAAEEFTVLIPEGDDRRPQIDQSYAAGRHKDAVNLADLALAEDELQRVKEEAGIAEEGPWWKRIIDRYYKWKDERPLHLVKKKVYLLLNILLGWCGIHRFYERRWFLGIFYLALCWTGLPAILCVTDFLIALPMKADANGMILI